MIELIVGSILIPTGIYLYIRNVRTQPKLSVGTRQKYVHRGRNTSPNLRSARINWDLDFSNNSSFDAHSVNLEYFNGNDLSETIPFPKGNSFAANSNQIVRINLQGEIDRFVAEQGSQIEIFSELFSSHGLEFKFFIEYQNKFGATFYTLVFIKGSEINTKNFYLKSQVLKKA